MMAKKETIEEPTQPLTVSTAKMVNHACQPLLRSVLRPRLCYVLQLLAGGCVTCYSFWRGAVLRVTAFGRSCVTCYNRPEQPKGHTL